MSGIKRLANMYYTRRVVQSRSRPCPATTGSSEVPVHLYTPVCSCAHSVHLTCAKLCAPFQVFWRQRSIPEKEEVAAEDIVRGLVVVVYCLKY